MEEEERFANAEDRVEVMHSLHCLVRSLSRWW